MRDIYAFKKGFPYPQLKLQVYKHLDAYVKRQEQVSQFMIYSNDSIVLSYAVKTIIFFAYLQFTARLVYTCFNIGVNIRLIEER